MAPTPMADDPFQDIVESHFRVYERRVEPLPGGVARMYFLMFPADELERRYEAVREALLARDRDLIVYLRHEGGEDILVVAPRAPVLDQSSRLNWILLVATLVTTVMSGAIYWGAYRSPVDNPGWAVLWSPEHLLWGFITLALPLMLILGVHETAHYFAAKRHGLRATLPYFIPFPPIFLPIGTLGAFIRLKDPLPDRKALFDVGASGPLAGFVVAIPVLLLGGFLTDAEAVEIPDVDRPDVLLDAPYELDEDDTGTTVLRFIDPQPGSYRLTVHSNTTEAWDYSADARVVANGTTIDDAYKGTLDEGETALRTITLPANVTEAQVTIEWEDGLISFGDPLLVKGLRFVGLGGGDHLTHPTFFAGWVGLLITGLNLLPASQLDGGHIARAVLGERMRLAAYAAVGLLFYLAFRFQTWLLLAILILFMGVYHPPPLNDRVKLDPKRIAMAVLVAIVLVVTFIPRPIIF